MMNYYDGISRAFGAYKNSKTLKTILFNLGGVPITIEWFDFGEAMGWADQLENLGVPPDLRFRLYVDGKLIPSDEHSQGIVGHSIDAPDLRVRRPKWLPKKLTIKQWNKSMGDLEHGL